jgi:hypothetical protein
VGWWQKFHITYTFSSLQITGIIELLQKRHEAPLHGGGSNDYSQRVKMAPQ